MIQTCKQRTHYLRAMQIHDTNHSETLYLGQKPSKREQKTQLCQKKGISK